MLQFEEFRKLLFENGYLVTSHKIWDLHLVYYIVHHDSLDDFVKFMDGYFLGYFESFEEMVSYFEREDDKTYELIEWIKKYRTKGLITDESAVQSHD